ncbi:MAG: hypothetical protein ACI9OJ_005217, partial [Myxococcota bacterium]
HADNLVTVTTTEAVHEGVGHLRCCRVRVKPAGKWLKGTGHAATLP